MKDQSSVRAVAIETGIFPPKPVMRPGEKLTQAKLMEFITYDPETGEMTWKVTTSSRAVAGSRAGSDRPDGYRQIRINKKIYLSHRLAWLYVYGYFPEHQIDHISRVRSDNSINNLREATQTCNMKNTGLQSNSSTGIKGVCFFQSRQVYIAHITINRRHKRLYESPDMVEAVAHRLAAEQHLNWFECSSDSTAYQFMQNYLKENQCI